LRVDLTAQVSPFNRIAPVPVADSANQSLLPKKINAHVSISCNLVEQPIEIPVEKELDESNLQIFHLEVDFPLEQYSAWLGS